MCVLNKYENSSAERGQAKEGYFLPSLFFCEVRLLPQNVAEQRSEKTDRRNNNCNYIDFTLH